MRKNIFICIIFAVSISACTEELDKEINIETNSSLYDLSESEALTIAKTFQHPNHKLGIIIPHLV